MPVQAQLPPLTSFCKSKYGCLLFVAVLCYLHLIVVTHHSPWVSLQVEPPTPVWLIDHPHYVHLSAPLPCPVGHLSTTEPQFSPVGVYMTGMGPLAMPSCCIYTHL